ncbi:FecR family protein [Chryseobacterium sp. C39-AII1]|uniref:FecR family protein n=1 Tax=Chryseobacterium sp. C39-AII1 TaxID=3080332 RepID=UPI00320B4260
MNSKEEFENAWNSIPDDQRMDDITDRKIWNGIENTIKKQKNKKKIYWVAAVLVPFIAFLMIFKTFKHSKTESRKEYVYESKESLKSFQLPDGSIIELQPHSKLIVSENFGKKDRNVNFIGKGIFSITKDKTKPFRIAAGDFKVQVLGTKFFLDQKSEEKKVELFEGKVKIEHQNKITYLLPKEIWINGKGNENVHFYNPEKQKDFTFNNTEYAEAIQQLEKTYNIKISYPEKFSHKKVSGAFTGNLNEVLSVISFPFNLKPERKNSTEIILK